MFLFRQKLHFHATRKLKTTERDAQWNEKPRIDFGCVFGPPPSGEDALNYSRSTVLITGTHPAVQLFLINIVRQSLLIKHISARVSTRKILNIYFGPKISSAQRLSNKWHRT